MDREKEVARILLRWHKQNRRVFPWRKERIPYKVLVAEFLLQRTPANRVADFFPKFIEDFPSPEKLASVDPFQLEEVFHRLGLKKRASWLVESMKIVCQKYDGEIPDTLEDLTALRGIGEYTASAILCFGFGKDVPIVDANVARVLSRVFFGTDAMKRASNNEALRTIAAKIVPIGFGPQYNEALLDHAGLICKKQPKCVICPISGLCEYYKRVINPP